MTTRSQIDVVAFVGRIFIKAVIKYMLYICNDEYIKEFEDI